MRAGFDRDPPCRLTATEPSRHSAESRPADSADSRNQHRTAHAERTPFAGVGAHNAKSRLCRVSDWCVLTGWVPGWPAWTGSVAGGVPVCGRPVRQFGGHLGSIWCSSVVRQTICAEDIVLQTGRFAITDASRRDPSGGGVCAPISTTGEDLFMSVWGGIRVRPGLWWPYPRSAGLVRFLFGVGWVSAGVSGAPAEVQRDM